MRIYLLGFMASGKSSLGPVVARNAGLDFVDLDEEVVRAAGKSIAEIFAEEGEAAFRDLESAALERVCRREHLVLATGGGIVERVGNRELLAAGYSVYLHWPWEILRERLAGLPAGERPLVDAGEEVLKLRWESREPLYEELTDLTLDMTVFSNGGRKEPDLEELSRVLLDTFWKRLN